MLKKTLSFYNYIIEKCQKADFIALLAIRLYLLPVIYEGAHSKVTGFDGVVTWFSSPVSQGGLDMPFPFAMAILATGTEVIGLICIALGLFTRIISIPMIIVMSVASSMVHLSHGWLAIASKSMESSQRLDIFLQWLSTEFPGRYNYITELGDPVILNNGMEFSVTYFVMLLVLFFWGGGRYISIDYWLKRMPIFRLK